MTFQLSTLPTECLHEILKHFENNISTLHSCLLVNRLWCRISVRILWRNVWNYKDNIIIREHSLKVSTSILITLISCLPNDSKEILYKNEISILTPTLRRSPLFNYAEFCKVLSIDSLSGMVQKILKNECSVLMDEFIKMFVNQISSLEKLTYNCRYNTKFSFTYFPGARDLSKLCCRSNLPTNFFWQLSKICHNIQSISIDVRTKIPDELNELISSQNNLRNLTLIVFGVSLEKIIPSLTKNSNTITKLCLYSENNALHLSFISLLTNLQEIFISIFDDGYIDDFKKLQYVNFSKLKKLKIPYHCPNPKYLNKFLEINGKNLENFYSGGNDKNFGLSIANFCPNIKNLFVLFYDDEINLLRNILISCQYLESIKIHCGKRFLSEREILGIIVNYSQNNFYELKLYNDSYPNPITVTPQYLESIFINWKNRESKKLLNLVIIEDYEGYNGLINEANMMIIKKYENLGIIKFVVRNYEEESIEEKEEYFF
ncbi:uncharacterized protein OCT59_027486 [Rhizophagus irregularis]|uniref:F-box domain-containing protein n=2 Tax=Rhizophagus irregularis TaxID=588596 RepID=A0A015KB87_RHIIW|nr:hypothetical protein RirG_029200 [Rhizophagus irregularis DAOM 197198w]UZO07191.1 hypothetical protein OCT59_027486 [Rhizophagus irregularis]GBC44936.1 hypothetical protein GLOIN_2v1876445 [Rhizophagus irregularis DAOM 181602=DAOM 197198]